MLLLAGCSAGGASAGPRVGEPAPDFRLQNLDGQIVSLSDPIPTTLFIDEDGIIQEEIIGAFSNKESIELYLSKIIP